MSMFGHIQLSEHFQLREMRCPCCDAFLADEKLIALLEEIRRVTGQPLHINSGYRCLQHNTQVNGFQFSFHMQGLAADVTNENVRKSLKDTALQIGEFVRDFAGAEHGNVIYYPGRGFIHCDVGRTAQTFPLVREKK